MRGVHGFLARGQIPLCVFDRTRCRHFAAGDGFCTNGGPCFGDRRGAHAAARPDALGMFMAADIVVKAVMVGLVFASVLTWTIWFAKAVELMNARRRLGTAIDALNQARSWSEATVGLQKRDDSAATLIRSADNE